MRRESGQVEPPCSGGSGASEEGAGHLSGPEDSATAQPARNEAAGHGGTWGSKSRQMSIASQPTRHPVSLREPGKKSSY